MVSLAGERLLEVEMAYDEIGEQEITSRTESQVVRIQSTQNPEEIRQKAEVIPWVALQRAGQVMDEVTKLMDVGRLDEALIVLNQAIAWLKSYGPGAPVGEAVQQLESLQGRLASGEWGARERKLSRYSSHTHRKMSSTELWTARTTPPSYKQMGPTPPIPPTPPADPNAPPPEGKTS